MLVLLPPLFLLLPFLVVPPLHVWARGACGRHCGFINVFKKMRTGGPSRVAVDLGIVLAPSNALAIVKPFVD